MTGTDANSLRIASTSSRPADLGHLQVGDDKVGKLPAQAAERFLAVLGVGDAPAGVLLEQRARHVAVEGGIIHDEEVGHDIPGQRQMQAIESEGAGNAPC